MDNKIEAFEELGKLVLELKEKKKSWDEAEGEVEILRERYFKGAKDDIDRKLRSIQLGIARIDANDFYMCDAKRLEEAKKITRADIEKQIQRSKEEKEEENHTDELVKKLKTEKYLASPRSYDYLQLKTKRGEPISKFPYFTARQDGLIDFIFSKIKETIPKMSAEECSLITKDDFDAMLAERELYPVAFTGFSFETSEVRKALGIRYLEKEMIEDFKEIRRRDIDARDVKVWANEKGKFEKVSDWTGSIIADVVTTRTTQIAPRTGDPLHKIHLSIGYITGFIFLNDGIRKKYCLFPIKFYKLPKQCQKIYRYLSLWGESRLNLAQFNELLDYKPAKNLTKLKNLIEGYLGYLKKEGFIYHWERIKETRGLETQWYILRLKKG